MKKLVLAILTVTALAFATSAVGVSIGAITPAHAEPCDSSSCS